MKVVPVVLCGGSGSRLWPVSRQDFPKPFMKMDGKTLFEHAVERGQACGFDDLLIVANENHFFQMKSILDGISDPPQTDYLLEPSGRNTAPAVALAALHIADRHGPDSVMLVLSADHLIPDTSAFVANALDAMRQAQLGQLVVFGIKPTSPETGFGYIKVSNSASIIQPVQEFVEKPNHAAAMEYLASGLHYWNSGMFCFTAGSYLTALEQLSPEVLGAARRVMESAKTTNGDEVPGTVTRFDEHIFALQPDISIDYAVMENAKNALLVPAKFSWSDVGTWPSVAAAAIADSNGNTFSSSDNINWISINTKNTHVQIDTQGPKAVIATVGIDNLIVVHTPDAILIADKSHAQDVKKVVSKLREFHPTSQQYQSTVVPTTVSRPWGTYTTLKEERGYKVKRITVSPGQRLSLQYHHHRAEHWTVVSGRALVQVDNDEFELGAGEYKYIPLGATHRLTNWGDEEMVLIEVQIGDYLGEDDIVRVEDVYGRQ